MSKLIIKEGERFGQLTVIKELPKQRLPSGQTNRIFLMKCDCGKQKAIRLLHFVRGRIISCGHLKSQHGDTGTKLYNTWRGMRNRCSKNYFQSQYYYDKGITIYNQWQKYSEFKKWAMDNNWKEGLVIDRINSDKGYFPENCRFVTQSENNLNRSIIFRINYNGEIIPLIQLLKRKNINKKHYAAIRGRIYRGWYPQKAVDMPIKKRKLPLT